MGSEAAKQRLKQEAQHAKGELDGMLKDLDERLSYRHKEMFEKSGVKKFIK